MAGYAAKPLAPSPLSLISAFRTLSVTPNRTFSSTSAAQAALKLPDSMPPYPYGPNKRYKQADTGLYGGGGKQYGNKISKGRNKGKTPRTWSPNIRREKLYSEALEREIEMKVRHRVLRTIRKVGGLDQYLLGEKPARIKELGLYGWKLRWMVMHAPKMKKQFAEERRALGLPPGPQAFKEFVQQKEEELDRADEARAVEEQQETSQEYQEYQEAPPMKA